MKLQGNLSLLSGGAILGARVENLPSDPSTPYLGQVWYNTGDKAYKGAVLNAAGDATIIIQFAVGGALANYVLKAGDSMTGSLTLSNGATVTGLAAPSANTDAATKKYVDDGLALKEPVVIGAATTIVQSDLTASRAVVSNASGKVDVSAVTTTELGYVSGVTSAIQTQIDSKEPVVIGAATTIVQSDLTASRLLESNASGKVSASSITSTELAYLSGVTSNIQTQIDAQVAVSGDTMTGNLNMGVNKVISSATPTTANDLTNKAYVDSAIAGVNWQQDVLGVQTDATLDPGASPTTGSRYVITDSGALNANFGTIAGVGNGDIVVFDGTNFVVAYDVSAQGANSEGTIAWDQATNKFVMYTGTAWNEFGGLSSLNAGTGLTWDSGVLNINLGAGIQQLPSDEVGVDLYSASGLFLTEDGTAASTSTAAKLSVLIDGSTLARSATGVKIADAGVTETQLNTSVAGGGLTGGAGTALAVGAGTGITVNANDVAIDTTWSDARYINVDGDTMTGTLTLNGAPSTDLMASTKKYVDDTASTLDTTLRGIISTLATRVDAGYVLYTSSGSALSHVVTHNMGIKYPAVTVVDSADQVILPQSITFDSTSALTVTFNSAIDCKVIVTGVKPVS